MKKVFKITIIFIMIYAMLIPMNKVYATQGKGTDGSGGGGQTSSSDSEDFTDIFSDANKFINKGKSGQDDFDIENFKINIDSIYNILLTIGIALTVIIGGILGIKFMMASAEDKAKIKEAMIPYVIGCIVIYGAFFIWKVVIMVVGDL